MDNGQDMSQQQEEEYERLQNRLDEMDDADDDGSGAAGPAKAADKAVKGSGYAPITGDGRFLYLLTPKAVGEGQRNEVTLSVLDPEAPVDRAEKRLEVVHSVQLRMPPRSQEAVLAFGEPIEIEDEKPKAKRKASKGAKKAPRRAMAKKSSSKRSAAPAIGAGQAAMLLGAPEHLKFVPCSLSNPWPLMVCLHLTTNSFEGAITLVRTFYPSVPLCLILCAMALLRLAGGLGESSRGELGLRVRAGLICSPLQPCLCSDFQTPCFLLHCDRHCSIMAIPTCISSSRSAAALFSCRFGVGLSLSSCSCSHCVLLTTIWCCIAVAQVNASSGSADCCTNPLDTDFQEFTHIAVTYTSEKKQWAIFVNGTEQGTSTATVGAIKSAAPWTLGANFNGVPAACLDPAR